MNDFLLFLAKPIIYFLPKAIAFLLVIFLILIYLADKIQERIIIRYCLTILVLAMGLYYRLCFAYFLRGTYDLWFWYQAAGWAAGGQNIYAVSSWYNYFPPWIIILTFFKKISLFWPELNFNFLVRIFLTLVDLVTAYFLYLLAKLRKVNTFKTMVAFFLNPILVMISGFHGQFENLAILMVVLGIYLHQRYKKFYPVWLVFTLGGIVKHMFFNQPLIYLIYYFKKNKTILKYFIFSLLIAIATLVPYWHGAGRLIIRDLALSVYPSQNYGVLFILKSLSLNFLIKPYTYLFIIFFLLFSWLFKSKDLLQRCLLGTLFFVVFSPSMSDQFFVLPIALASLTPSISFYLYTIFASLYLFGSSAQFDILFFKPFSWNFIFLVSLIWFNKIFFLNDKQTKN